jgi:hypothetical protein
MNLGDPSVSPTTRGGFANRDGLIRGRKGRDLSYASNGRVLRPTYCAAWNLRDHVKRSLEYRLTSVKARRSRWVLGSQIGHSTLSAGKRRTWGRAIGEINCNKETAFYASIREHPTQIKGDTEKPGNTIAADI